MSKTQFVHKDLTTKHNFKWRNFGTKCTKPRFSEVLHYNDCVTSYGHEANEPRYGLRYKRFIGEKLTKPLIPRAPVIVLDIIAVYGRETQKALFFEGHSYSQLSIKELYGREMHRTPIC